MRTHSEGEVVRLKKSISYWSFVGKSCVEAMRIAKDAGFEGIELAMDGAGDLTPHTTPAQLAQLKSAAEEIGIQLPSVASGLYWEHSFTSDDADERKRAHDTAVAQLHCAKALGADKLMFSSDMPQNTPAELAIFRAVFTSREDLAKVMAGTALRVFDIPLA